MTPLPRCLPNSIVGTFLDRRCAGVVRLIPMSAHDDLVDALRAEGWTRQRLLEDASDLLEMQGYQRSDVDAPGFFGKRFSIDPEVLLSVLRKGSE